MTPNKPTNDASKTIWLTIAVFIALSIVFAFYVYAEKQIDHANEARYRSYQLADQLRQSSDDLTRMVRAYVGTGDPRYKKYYQDILDIRNGKQPRPDGYDYAYWDMVVAHPQSPRPENGQAVALLDLMRQSGFTEAEFNKLAEAKANSDELVSLEIEAMKLVESGGPEAEANRAKARQMLIDDRYHQAKAKIMQPINDFFLLMEKRTADAVQTTAGIATLFRLLFIAVALAAIFMLWRSYRALRATLGGSIDEVYAHIAKIGCGDFGDTIAVDDANKNSVLGWLSATQLNLAQLNAERAQQENDFANISRLSQAVVDGADHLIITTDTQGVILSFNRAAEASLGYRAEELVGKLTPAVFHDPDEVVRRAQELTAAGLPVEPGFEVFVARSRTQNKGDAHEWTYVRKDGTRFPVSLTVSALRAANGDIYAFLGIATDISERSRAAQVQRENESRLAAILDNVLDGIITINELGAVESFNKSAEKIFGHAAAEVIGNNVKMLMPEPYHGEHDGYLHNYVSTGNKKIIGIGRQVVGKRKDGSTFPMDLAVSEMRMGDKRMFTGIVRDITERVKVDLMKSEFISTVSHELRTPLTSIRGSLALIVGGVVGELPAAVKPLLDIAHKNSERLILLVNDILDMEKIEAGKLEFDLQSVKLIPLLKQALESNYAYGEQFKVSYELENELPETTVKADTNRLLQVLANLLSNAAKFSPAGGKVLVAVEAIDQRIRISVKDNGTGIPDEFKNRIFQKFSQADASDTKKKGGTGLGLSITKAIVEQMGGRIGFESQPNELTTFWIELPLWQEPSLPVAYTGAAGKRKRVLICEDDHDIASLLKMMLEHEKLVADIAYDAAQAKQMLAQHEYAAMTLDLGLPDQSGTSLIRELRAAKETATLPIIVVSANADKGHKELNGEAFFVIDWIKKPIDREQLVTALQQALAQSSSVRPQVLHVEDDLDICQVVRTIVGEFADMENAASLAGARQKLNSKRYDLVILDITLPDGSGMELLHELNNATAPTPVMVFSAHEMGADAIQQLGASLVKSRTDNAQLLATIKRLIER